MKISIVSPRTIPCLTEFSFNAVKGILTGNSDRVSTATKHCAGKLLNIGIKTDSAAVKSLAGRMLNAGKKIEHVYMPGLFNMLLG